LENLIPKTLSLTPTTTQTQMDSNQKESFVLDGKLKSHLYPLSNKLEKNQLLGVVFQSIKTNHTPTPPPA
jgi:hypothetical protein